MCYRRTVFRNVSHSWSDLLCLVVRPCCLCAYVYCLCHAIFTLLM